MSEISLDDYKAMVGQEVGVSRWFEVSQGRIDTFRTSPRTTSSSTWTRSAPKSPRSAARSRTAS